MSSTHGVVYNLARVQVISFTEQTADPLRNDDKKPRLIDYILRSGAGLDEDQSEVTVSIMLGVDALPHETSEDTPTTDDDRIAEVVGACSFRIADLDALRDGDGSVVIPSQLMAVFVGISVSTTRGILVGRAQHRVFGEAPFPVLPPFDIVGDLAENASWIGPLPSAPPPQDPDE